MLEGANTHYYHYDRIGYVTGITSGTGQTEWTYTYEPFGTARLTTKVDPNAPVMVTGKPANATQAAWASASVLWWHSR